MAISIIIPVYNRYDLTSACLDSIARAENDVDIEIIVIDNASTDQTEKYCEQKLAQLPIDSYRYIRLDKNYNFAGACNIGAKSSKHEILFFLNNDTICTHGCLDILYNKSVESKYNIVSPLLAYPEFAGYKDRVQHRGIAFDPRFYAKHVYEFFPVSHPVCKKEHSFQCLTAAALMLHKELFFEAGLFDERFVNGGEDIALGLQLTALGCKNYVIPESMIYHLASQSDGIHDHAEHNAAILKEHYISHIMPDLQYILSQDGYELQLTPGLIAYIDLPENRKNILYKRVDKINDVVKLEDMIEKEPVCYSAYTKLSEMYKKLDKLDMFTNIVQLLLQMKPHPEIANYVMENREKICDPKLIARANSIVCWYKKAGRYRETKEIVESMIDFYTKNTMSSLCSIYTKWAENARQNKKWFA